MLAVKAHVEQGRLKLDEPTSLPEGEVVELVPLAELLARGGDALDAEERAELHSAPDEAEADIAAGRVMSTSPPTKLATLWPGHGFVWLAVNAEYLVTQEASVDGGGTLSAVTVYRLSDLSQVAVFPGGMSQQPVSFALTEQGILIEWDIFDGPYRRLVSRRHYGLSGAEPDQLSEHLV